MRLIANLASALALVLAPGGALAQSPTGKQIIAPAGYIPSTAIYCDDGTNHAMLCSFDTVIRASSTDRGAVVGTTAVTLAPTNGARRGWAIQVQASSSVTCYVNGTATATADYHSLQVGGGGYYQTPDGHVGTGALSVICSAASTPVYFREW